MHWLDIQFYSMDCSHFSYLTSIVSNLFSQSLCYRADFFCSTQRKIPICMYTVALGKRQAVVSKEVSHGGEKGGNEEATSIELREFLEHSGSFTGQNL